MTYQRSRTLDYEGMNFQEIDDLPLQWSGYEDIAIELFECFGEGNSLIYRKRFTDLIEGVLVIPNFEGKREDCSENHLG